MTADTTLLPSSADEAFFTGARHAHRLMDAIAVDAAPARALLVGTAGSGKSAALRRLQARLTDRDRSATWLDASVDIHEIPLTDVLIADDLHRQAPERIQALRRRAEDPSAALVVAVRPWPRSGPLRETVREMEHTMPTVVSGHVVAADVTAYLDAHGHACDPACLPHLLELTGGVTWLLSEALAVHQSQPCDDPAHNALSHLLMERIAQRLSGVDEQLRVAIERLSLAGADALAAAPDGERTAIDELIVQGYSEGLLLRNGEPPAVVRAAVRATTPLHRLVEVTAGHGFGASPATRGMALGSDVLLRRVRTTWTEGDLDATARLLDTASAETRLPEEDGLADAAAAVWSARTMMTVASDVHAAFPAHTDESTGHAVIAHVGAGRLDRLTRSLDGDRPRSPSPTTLGVALESLQTGLCATLAPEVGLAAVSDLVRATELYTSARVTLPIAELPAVIAAVAAIGIGELSIAQGVVDTALAGSHGGAWARRRLLLWSAWVAIHNERPAEAREALALAQTESIPAAPRDQLLESAVQLVLTRRYEDVPSLEALWQQLRDGIRHAQFDLYLLQPLAELVSTTARIGDSSTMAPHVTEALGMLERLGSPPLWSAHLHWAGIQQGILLNRPPLLAPHARALVDAGDRSRVAAAMSRAGRVWTSVLGGHVDADAVEECADGLAEVGLAWDGARLAGHGSGRTDDRKTASRLLACARRLHPHDAIRQATAAPAPAPAPDASPAPPTEAEAALSERELDVAHLVLQGKTYAEVGQAIFISPRTAEHHIARIRQRLGATSRSDLLAKLRVLLESPPAPARPRGQDGGHP